MAKRVVTRETRTTKLLAYERVRLDGDKCGFESIVDTAEAAVPET